MVRNVLTVFFIIISPNSVPCLLFQRPFVNFGVGTSALEMELELESIL